MLAHIHPSLHRFACEPRPLFNGLAAPGSVSRTIQGPPRTQSPFARLRCYLFRRDVSASRQRALPLLHRSYGLMRQTPSLPSSSVALIRRVFAGCLQSLLGNGPSRRYLCNPSIGAWTHTPECLSGALVRFFPESYSLSHVTPASAHPLSRRNATSTTANSRGGSHFIMFRLPWSLAPQVAPTAQALCPAGSQGVYATQWTGSYLPKLWYRYMTESDNYHGGSFTRWIAALSAAPCNLRSNRE